MIIKYIFFLLISVAFTIIYYLSGTWLVVPLFAKDGWLPRWLWWFQTPDNPLYGDEGHEKRWEYIHSYWQMVAWIFRNPLYGFEWDGPLAANIDMENTVYLEGNAWIKNRDNAVAGYYLCIVEDPDNSYWNFKWISPTYIGRLVFLIIALSIVSIPIVYFSTWLAWASLMIASIGLAALLPNDTAIMLELGWKLQGFAQHRETSGKAMFVFSPRLTAFYK